MSGTFLDLTITSLTDKENHDCNSVVAGLRSAITTKQRLFALSRLRKILQQSSGLEDDTSFVSSRNVTPVRLGNFDDFVNAGGGIALVLQLHHLVHSHGSVLAELELLCFCLAKLFGLIRRQFDKIKIFLSEHDSDVLLLLSDASLIASQRRQYTNTCQNVPSVQNSAVTIFNIVTSSSSGTNLLLKCHAAVEMISRILCDIETTDDTVTQALGIYKNLTYFQEDCRVKLIKSSGFLQSLSLSSIKSISLKSRQRQSAVIRNLAISVECRSLLVAEPTTVGTLIQLLNWEPQSTDDSSSPDFRNMRRNVLNTLVSLTMDHDSALLLIFYGDGILLHILQRYLKVSTDTFLRKKSACVMRLLANEASAPLLVHDANLMQSLSDAALRDDSSDVRREAAEAFARCAAFVQLEQQPHYENVLDALTILVNQRGRLKSFAMNSLARALKEQSLHPCNQLPMADRSVLLNAIAQIALLREFESNAAATDACCALMNLSTDKANLEKLAGQEIILEALLSNASTYTTTHGNFEEGKLYALTTLVNLSNSSNCRRIMIWHGCILQTLIHETRCISDEQSDLKVRLKQATLLLAAEL
jgi:hypothetical protein